MNRTNNLVIIGTSHHNTYGMIRCFGEYGVRPNLILYGNSHSYILKSALLGEKYVAKDAHEALSLLLQHYNKSVVIACTDEIASLMDNQYDSLKEQFAFFNCGAEGQMTHYMDKVVQITMAQKCRIDVPYFIKGTVTNLPTSDLHYPCIIRPLKSINGGKNIQVCYDSIDLPKALASFDDSTEILAQEFIEKDFEIVLVGLSYGDTLEIPAYIQKIRDTKGGTTYSSVKSVETLPSHLLASCKDLVKMMNYTGLFGIELMRKDDKYYFVEINLRNDATTFAICMAGCNLPLAYWHLANGNQTQMLPPNIINQIHSMVEFNDFIHVLKRQVSIRTWLKQRADSECRYCYCKSDKRPYRIQCWDFVKFIVGMVYRHGLSKAN